MKPMHGSKNEPDHVFWAIRWSYARLLCKSAKKPYQGFPDIAMCNYVNYLTEVFSWMMENKIEKGRAA